MKGTWTCVLTCFDNFGLQVLLGLLKGFYLVEKALVANTRPLLGESDITPSRLKHSTRNGCTKLLHPGTIHKLDKSLRGLRAVARSSRGSPWMSLLLEEQSSVHWDPGRGG